MSNNGNGRCDCDDFKRRRWPLLRDGVRKRWKTRCKHIRWFRMVMVSFLKSNGYKVTLDEVIKESLKRFGDGEAV